jgi:hypothetical protein
MTTTKPTKAEATKIIAAYGYTLRKDGDEFEVYPKGFRATAYFTDCILDAISTTKLIAISDFKQRLSFAGITGEVAEALAAWYAYHKKDWKQNLQQAWYTGAYAGFSTKDESSTLQRFRNSGGQFLISHIA